MAEVSKLTITQIWLNLKTIFTDYKNILLMVSVIFIMLLVSIIFIPIHLGYGIVINVTSSIILASVYSSVNHTYRHSTLFSDSRLTRSNRYVFYISTIMTMSIVAIFSFTFTFLCLIVINHSNLLLMNWFFYEDRFTEGGQTVYFNPQLFAISILVILQIVLIMFSLSFAFQHIIDNKVTYFGLIISIEILIIIFGGAFNSYFWPYSADKIPEGGVIFAGDPLFPMKIYWLSAINPFFSTGSQANIAMTISKIHVHLEDGKVVNDLYTYGWTSFLNLTEDGVGHKTLFEIYGSNNTDMWKLMTWMPVIESLIFIGIGLLISRFKTKR